MNELLTMFMRDVLGLKGPDFGSEFSEIRAKNAYDLISATAKNSVVLREQEPNTFGFFPRISVRDHADVLMLLPLVDERTAELKSALLNAAGAYALGSETLLWSELKDLRDEYLASARLSLALEAEHKRWHKDQEEIRAAADRASSAFQDECPPNQD